MRHSGGGNIDAFILEKLLRKAWMYWKGRVGEPYWNMHYAFPGHMVVLVDQNTASDGEAFADGFRRQHGRLLGYLWTKDRRLLNEQMIEEGFAVLFTVPPNVKHVERLTAAQKRAQTGRRGIWGEGGLRE